MNDNLSLEDVQSLLFAAVAEQSFWERFQDESKEEEKTALVESIRGESDKKLEEIFSIQFQTIFASSSDRT